MKGDSLLAEPLSDHEAPGCLARLVAGMGKAGVSFNFHIRGEKLACVRSDTLVVVQFLVGLSSLS
jgi:hypothetical protein